MNRIQDEARINQLIDQLVELTKGISIPEDRKRDWRWVSKLPLTAFFKCAEVKKVVKIIEILKVLHNDCFTVAMYEE